MTIHFINGSVKEDVKSEHIDDILEQMKDENPPMFALVYVEDKLKLAVKLSQVLYID